MDRGSRGHDYPNKYRVFRSGQKRGVNGVIKKELRKRSLVEPIIGHLKSDGYLGRNYLKGELGDKQNVMLTAVGYNFRLLLKLFRHVFLPSRYLPILPLMVMFLEVWEEDTEMVC